MLACVAIKISTRSLSMQQEPHDYHYMELALQQAALAPHSGEVPIGAVLVHDHKVIAVGHNYREISQDPTAHAEMIVIRKAAEWLHTWRLNETTLYVTLEPCPMCAGSILDIPAERRLNHRVQVMGGLLEQESRALLQNFFRAKRGLLSESSSFPKPTS